MMELLKHAVIFCIAVMSASVQSLDCLVSTRDGLPMDNQPLYIQNGNLAKFNLINGGSYISVAAGRSLTLACPGNTIQVSGKETETAVCVSGSTFMVNGAAVDLVKVSCSSSVKNGLLQTTRGCGPTGSKIIEVGFQVGSTWYKLFETCHDNSAGVSSFATHILSSVIIIGGQRNPNRPAFKKGLSTIYSGLDPDVLYKKTSQQKMLFDYLGTNKYYDDVNLFLVRGHLSPDADWVLSTAQFATYFYVNTEPEWTALNGGNWLAVEKKTRELANNTLKDLEVTTGSFGILELEDINGTMRKIYMDPSVKGIPVPRLFWKAVYEPVSQSGIIFLMENNPFKEAIKICPDVCSANGWTFTNSIVRGIIYCCNISEAVKTVNYVPHGDAVSVLKWVPPK